MEQCSNTWGPLTIFNLLLHQSLVIILLPCWSFFSTLFHCFSFSSSEINIFPDGEKTYLSSDRDVRRATEKIIEANTISLPLHPWLLTLFFFFLMNSVLHVQNACHSNWLLWKSDCIKMEQIRCPANASLSQVTIFSTCFQNYHILKTDSWFLEVIYSVLLHS